MHRITRKGLRKHLDERVSLANGTLTHKVFTSLFGQDFPDIECGTLLEDNLGFYINVINPKGLELSHIYRIKNHDLIAIPVKSKEKRYDARFYEVDLTKC